MTSTDLVLYRPTGAELVPVAAQEYPDGRERTAPVAEQRLLEPERGAAAGDRPHEFDAVPAASGGEPTVVDRSLIRQIMVDREDPLPVFDELHDGDPGGYRPLSRIASWIRARRHNLLWLTPTLVLGAIVHVVGMTGSPQRTDGEGAVVSQAWAILQYGQLTHYPYLYDHPPLGWMQLALYAEITQAFQRWDVAVMAGREAMFIAALASGVLLFLLARRVGLARPAAAAAMLLFLLSPLALDVHRTVLIENLATPWLLLAWFLALSRRGQLLAFAGSALALGVAVLTEHTVLLAVPFVAWSMMRSANPASRRYTLPIAVSVFGLAVSSIALLAAVRGEFFPADGRASLVGGVVRGVRDTASVAHLEALLGGGADAWLRLGGMLVVASLVAAAIVFSVGRLRPMAAFVLVSAFGVAVVGNPASLIGNPGVAIAIIPFAALLVAAAVGFAARHLRLARGGRRLASLAVLVAASLALGLAAPGWVSGLHALMTEDLDAPVRQAQAWTENEVSRDKRLLIDTSMWVDLTRAGWDRANVVWYAKVDTDPAVAAASPAGWRDMDYVVVTESMRRAAGRFPTVSQAVANSQVVASFGDGDGRVEVRRVLPEGARAARAAADVAAQARATLGAQLAENPHLVTSAEDRELVRSGGVDTRITELLGALASAGPVEIAGFPLVPGETSDVHRQVAVASVAGRTVTDAGAPTDEVEAMLSSLPAQYAPERVTVADGVLLLTYSLAR